MTFPSRRPVKGNSCRKSPTDPCTTETLSCGVPRLAVISRSFVASGSEQVSFVSDFPETCSCFAYA